MAQFAALVWFAPRPVLLGRSFDLSKALLHVRAPGDLWSWRWMPRRLQANPKPWTFVGCPHIFLLASVSLWFPFGYRTPKRVATSLADFGLAPKWLQVSPERHFRSGGAACNAWKGGWTEPQNTKLKMGDCRPRSWLVNGTSSSS